ncbi:M61 family metallopeptidase [Altericista sp. CCNU0014]|uniref:M61 family metallopeptidase n=1 Tax=Altericista sp. CCNU0014 TaxID=3082949 RepID=UPI00384E243E
MVPVPSSTSAISEPIAADAECAEIAFHYTVAMPQPANHLFEVSFAVQDWSTEVLDLKFPVWTPGSYLVREYARHLQGFTALDTQGQPLPWHKVGKNHWQVETQGNSTLAIQYRIFANELTVRTNHLDMTHGYFNPAAMFFRVPEYEERAIAITICAPQNWLVSTPLPAASQPNTFIAASFDELVDSPFEIGTHALYDFEVLGKPHQFAIWGEGNFNIERLLADTQKIIETEAALFEGLPYDRYLFLLHLSANGHGGLEHKSACSLIYSRFGLRSEDSYQKFMSLVAHEFFHLWNVKRIRPKGLEVFDYDRENYTDSLWFCEGTTSFYDLVVPFRAGIYDAKCYLKKVSEAITQLQTIPGRKVQPLSESSFDAWIKLYRPDANSRNAQVSYYLKGELVSFLLDLVIRAQHQNRRSLDDVMRQLWQQFGQPEVGFTRDRLKAIFESVAEIDLTRFWASYIDGTAELPFDEILAPFGLALKAEVANPAPYLGLTAKTEQGATIVKFVEANSPAEQAGIEPGDELLAIANFRVTAEQLNDRLQHYQPKETIAITVFHQDVLRECAVTLGEPMPSRWTLQSVAQPTATQQNLFEGWLKIDLTAVG